MKKIKKIKVAKKEDAWDYFDDCAICQAMKKADKEGKSLGLEELEIEFAKQNLKNKTKIPRP